MTAKVNLTDSEWVLLLDAHCENSALPICCSNVSDLRDVIGLILRGGRELNDIYARMLLDKYEIFLSSHDFDGEILGRLVAQAEDFLKSSKVI